MWKEAIEKFEKSLNDYLDLVGVVPRKEHQILLDKCEKFSKEIADLRKVVTSQKKEINSCEKVVSAKEDNCRTEESGYEPEERDQQL